MSDNPKLDLLFVKIPNHVYRDKQLYSDGEIVALDLLEMKKHDEGNLCKYYIPVDDFSGKSESEISENNCSSFLFDKRNCLIYHPVLCDWNDKLWKRHLYMQVETICDEIFSQSLLPFFAVDGKEANGQIVQILHDWGWYRIR